MDQRLISSLPSTLRSFLGRGSLLAISSLLSLGALGLTGGCNTSGGAGGGQVGVPGEEASKPNGDFFFVDPNQGGGATRLRIAQMFWGRIVDVHDVDALGDTNPAALFRDMVINENVLSNQSDYILETNAITQTTRLIIQRTKGAPDTGTGTFTDLLRTATNADNMPPITPKNDDGTSPEPFSFIARNSCLVIRMDDLLDDSPEAAANLAQTVKILTGYSPINPFQTRVIFDPNHGALVDGEFHSTRVIVDMTVSETESAAMPNPVPVNSLGLPASLGSTGQPNISIRIPSKTDFGSGVFEILTNLRGKPMATAGNGPVDFGSGGLEVVRAMRSGNQVDTNNGFLLDLNPPEIVGGWSCSVDTAADDPTGTPGFDFVVDITFQTTCRAAPTPGDIIALTGRFLEVTETAGTPDPVTGEVDSVRVRVLSDTAVGTPALLVGGGLFRSTFSPLVAVDQGCWVSFAPQPGIFPATNVPTSAQVLVRFTEPMDPDSLQPFDTFVIVRSPIGLPFDATDIVVGDIQASGDLKEFTFTPLLPFSHSNGSAEEYHVELMGGSAGVTDLAGNALANSLAFISFFIDMDDPSESNGGVVMRFNDINEIDQHDPDIFNGNADVRGQFFYDLAAGVIFPRPAERSSFFADRLNPVPSIMIPFPAGVQTPLSPLGSKLQTVWRYCDFGFNVRDETRYNLDVEGLNWAPISGQVVADFYDTFEMRLSHSRRLPDEYIDSFLLPKYPGSGLVGGNNQYTENILEDPAVAGNSQQIVHPRTLGYTVSPINLFTSASGTQMLPFPLNLGTGDPVTYTWRDTTNLGTGGQSGNGVPLDIELLRPLAIDPGPKLYFQGQVPTIGLPLLMEYRCFPTGTGVGLNSFDISLAVNSSAQPNFRAFSTGGVNSGGTQVFKDPDLELTPSGGFNPNANGATTPGVDNSFYIGQMDTVTRISRAHTIWIDAENDANWLNPVVEPSPAAQPDGTSVLFDFRGANGFTPALNGDAFDAQSIDAYGDPDSGTVQFFTGDEAWSSDIDDFDGAQFIQVRMTFVNNIVTGLAPELSALGIAFERD